MRKLLFLFITLCTFFAGYSQPTRDVSADNVIVNKRFAPPFIDTIFVPWRIGQMVVRPQDSILYVGIKTTAGGKKWDKLGARAGVSGGSGGATDTTNISNRIDAKADTSGVWRKTGTYNTSPSTDYIGTADLQPLVFKVNNIWAGFLTARPEPNSAGSGSVVLGQYAGQELGTNNGANTLIGHGAGSKIKYNPSKTNQNTFIGLWAGYWTKYHSDPFGGRSVLVGQSSGFWNYDGSSLAGLGCFSLEMNNRGNNNTAIGRDALRSNIDGSYGTGVGSLSLLYNTTGIKTIAVTNGGSGYTTATVTISAPPGPTPGVAWAVATATATISGGEITGITITDPGAGYSINYADSNTRHPEVTVTITGDGTGATASVTETESAMGNTALGHGSGYLNKFGNYNVEIGYLTTLNSRGDYNTLIGYQAGPGTGAPTVMSNGIAIGKNAKVSANNSMALGGTGADTIRVGINTETPRFKLDVVGGDILVHELRIGRGAGSVATNTVFGDSALANNTSQFGNTVFGYQASKNGTPSSANTIIGYRAGNSSTYAGTGNIIVGYEAQYLNRANESVAIGLRSMYTQGSNGSVGVGAYTLYNNVRNTSVGRAMNTAIGDYSYYSLTGSASMQFNTGIGGYSGYGITTGSYNTAIGGLSMGKGYSGVGTAGSSGTFNTALGHASLYYQNNSSGNIGIGANAFNNSGFNPSLGYNIGIGFEAGKLMTTGDYNVLLGGYTGSSHAAVSNHIILSDGQGNVRFILDSLANTKFYGTGAHVFQKGTTAQRPTIESASFRYNTDSSKFEWSDGINWYTVGASTGPAGANNYPTGITYTQSSRTLAIQRNGLSDISTTIPTATSSLPGLMSAADKARLDSNFSIRNIIRSGYDTTLRKVSETELVAKAIKFTNGSNFTFTINRTDTTIEVIGDATGGGAGVSDGDKGDITISGSGATYTIDNSAVTLAKMANISSGKVIGRTTAGSGAPEEVDAAVINLSSPVSGEVLKYDATNSEWVNKNPYYDFWQRINSDYTATNTNSSQSIFPSSSDAVTLEASTTYEFEMFILVTNGTTTTTKGLTFNAGTATFTDFVYEAMGQNVAANTTGTAQSTAYSNTAANTVILATGTTSWFIKAKGTFTVNAGGTFIPQFKFSADPTGTVLVKTGTWFGIKKIGTSSTNNIGGWN